MSKRLFGNTTGLKPYQIRRLENLYRRRVRPEQIISHELARDISNQLTEYIRSPQVTVIVTNPSSTDYQQTVRVTGAVGAPSSMPYRKGMTVLDVVLAVGGPTDFASPNKAKLYRIQGGGLKTYPIYLNDILKKGHLETNYTLVPGDIITVPERAF